MATNEIVIATRLLTCKWEGQTVEATAHLGKPFEQEGAWVCEYGVTFSGVVRQHQIIGEDSLQALQLGIAMLGSLLMSLEETSDWRWNGEAYVGLPTSAEEPLFGNMP
jgi:hypothetical protein